MNDLDGLIAQLARQPLPRRLEQMETAVAQGIHKQLGPIATTRSWRFAATALALALGIGVGTSAASVSDRPAIAADLTAGVRLAPSSLLDASR